ncbi:MAG: hypothetical protein M0005_01230 [Actinomycetota bacterium]|nr:hypothetical protein [Actinomycetota bacterium]
MDVQFAGLVLGRNEGQGGGEEFEERLRTIASINGELANRALARDRPQELERIRQRLAG